MMWSAPNTQLGRQNTLILKVIPIMFASHVGIPKGTIKKVCVALAIRKHIIIGAIPTVREFITVRLPDVLNIFLARIIARVFLAPPDGLRMTMFVLMLIRVTEGRLALVAGKQISFDSLPELCYGSGFFVIIIVN
jgi:hypothetical protein